VNNPALLIYQEVLYEDHKEASRLCGEATTKQTLSCEKAG
jgi:hypothetical protein